MITSKLNEKVKQIASLKQKKYRDEYMEYFVEGVKIALEVIKNSEDIKYSELLLTKICYASELLMSHQGGDMLLKEIERISKTKSRIEIIEVDGNVFKCISDTTTPQGVLCVIKKPQHSLEDMYEKIKNGEQFLLLDQISDAGNMGTIIRTACSFDTFNIVCTKNTVEAYNPKVLRSTMGAIFKVNIWYVSDELLEQVIEQFKQNGYDLLITSLDAKKYIHEIDINKKSTFVMGNEANGVSDKLKKACSSRVKIDITEKQESLNVAIATGIVLHEKYIKNKSL